MGLRPDSNLGTHFAIAPPLASRPVSPCLCESTGAGQFPHHRRLDLPSSRDVSIVMPASDTAWTFAGRPRSEEHLEPGFQCNSALAVVRFDECVLRLWVHERNSGRAISRSVLAGTHHIRRFAGEDLF